MRDSEKKTTKAQKFAYVVAQRQTRRHVCHWPGCQLEVPPARWGCKSHWMRLPKRLRDLIWATYRPGQEITKKVSPEYLDAARQVREWIGKRI